MEDTEDNGKESPARTLVKVIVPIYRLPLTEYETVALEQIYRTLGRYPIVVIRPQGLDLSPLLQRFPSLGQEAFEDRYFDGISGYNRLMLSDVFYGRFADSEYILIAQLDSYVFRDELEQWCLKGYDYIGAPWIVRPIYRFPLLRLASWTKKHYCRIFRRPNSQITNYRVGNGGFSLRRVDTHLKATTQLRETISGYLSHRGNHIFNEDVFFAVEVNRHGLRFRYPEYREALAFSFDKYPRLCYKLNGERLPFGCHAWYYRKMKDFWFPIILNPAEK